MVTPRNHFQPITLFCAFRASRPDVPWPMPSDCHVHNIKGRGRSAFPDGNLRDRFLPSNTLAKDVSKALEPRRITPESTREVNQAKENPAPIYTDVFGEKVLEFSPKTQEEIGRSSQGEVLDENSKLFRTEETNGASQLFNGSFRRKFPIFWVKIQVNFKPSAFRFKYKNRRLKLIIS
ncbi:hypothetical protein LINPERPRIM_LOCUS32836 [Linum perenne]